MGALPAKGKWARLEVPVEAIGLYGDKIGETGYYGDGVFYNYNWGKVAARLYEIKLP